MFSDEKTTDWRAEENCVRAGDSARSRGAAGAFESGTPSWPAARDQASNAVSRFVTGAQTARTSASLLTAYSSPQQTAASACGRRLRGDGVRVVVETGGTVGSTSRGRGRRRATRPGRSARPDPPSFGRCQGCWGRRARCSAVLAGCSCCRRTCLTTSSRPCRVPLVRSRSGAGKQQGEVVVFTPEQRRAVDDVLGGYLANYEACGAPAKSSTTTCSPARRCGCSTRTVGGGPGRSEPASSRSHATGLASLSGGSRRSRGWSTSRVPKWVL